MPISTLSRRQFLASASAFVALAAGSAFVGNQLWDAKNSRREYLLITDSGKAILGPVIRGMLRVTDPGSVNVFDVKTGQTIRIAVPFFGHSVVQDPRHPHRFVSFEKWGQKGALVDIDTQSIVANALTEDGHMFFGHAAYVDDGAVLVTSEDSYGGKDGGKLILRDRDTLEPIQAMDSYGLGPHQCLLLPDKKTLLVANGGGMANAANGGGTADMSDVNGKTNMTWIDVQSGRLVHKAELSVVDGDSYGHMAVAADGWICAVGLNQASKDVITARAVMISPEGKIIKLNMPDDLPGEALSVSFLGSSGLVAMTLPGAKRVYVWNYKDQSLFADIHFRKPNGVLAGAIGRDGVPSLIVSSEKTKDLSETRFDMQTHQYSTTLVDSGFGGDGAHLTRSHT